MHTTRMVPSSILQCILASDKCKLHIYAYNLVSLEPMHLSRAHCIPQKCHEIIKIQVIEGRMEGKRGRLRMGMIDNIIMGSCEHMMRRALDRELEGLCAED